MTCDRCAFLKYVRAFILTTKVEDCIDVKPSIQIRAFHSAESGLEWLHDTPVGRLPEVVHRHLEEARGEALQDGYRRGYDVAVSDLENRLQRDFEVRQHALELRMETDVQEAISRERVLLEREFQARDAERLRDFALHQVRETEERARKLEALLADRERQVEERLRREILSESAQLAEKRLLALEDAYERGRRDGASRQGSRQGPPPSERPVEISDDPDRLERVRKQSFQNGYDQGVQRGRLEGEARLEVRIHDARREGFQEGLRSVRGPVRERAWALGALHLQEGATPETVRQRHRRLTRHFHPDHHPELDDAHIKALNRARDLLES